MPKVEGRLEDIAVRYEDYTIEGEPDLSDIDLPEGIDIDYTVNKYAEYDPDKVKKYYEMNIYEFANITGYKKLSGFLDSVYKMRYKPPPQ